MSLFNKKGKYAFHNEDDDEVTTTCSIGLRSRPNNSEIPSPSQTDTGIVTKRFANEEQSQVESISRGQETEQYTELQKELKECKGQVGYLEDDKHALSSSHVRSDARRQEQEIQTGQVVHKLQEELNEFKGKVRYLEDEKQTLLSRLSEFMGRQLAEGNPHITNLNDPNRPQKVGEMFVSVYDNEWTDVYSSLEESGTEPRNIIDLLVNILKKSYDGCKEQISKFSSHIKELFPGYDASFYGKVLDFITSISQTMISFLTEEIKKEMGYRFTEEITEVSSAFINRCVQLCFFMVTKSPPMYLCFDCTVIDKQVYKIFTKTGDTFDYLVWPALYLYEDGPLIEKGVVQCK